VPFTLEHAGKYRTEDRLKNTHSSKTKQNPEKANNTKHSKTKLPWFSYFLRHSARKQGNLILQHSWAYTVITWIGLSSVLRPHQHRIGYMGDGFTGQKTQPTVAKY